jgi:hypothetical protein
MTVTCRRCIDCREYSHHWMDHGDFGNDEAHPEIRGHSHVCKHCGTLGDECDCCDGNGYDLAGEGVEVCPKCEGEGVTEA